jgi:hypothetical protein
MVRGKLTNQPFPSFSPIFPLILRGKIASFERKSTSMELSERKKQILELLLQQPQTGITGILKGLPGNPPVSTINRDLKALVDTHLLIKTGQGRSTV